MRNTTNSLLGFSALYLTICSSGLAMQEDEEWKKWSFLRFAKKCLWGCCLPSPMWKDDRNFLLKGDTVIIEFFKDIPLEILYHILYNLSPLDIFHMSKTSKNLNEKIEDRFWDNYLKIHQQDRWDKSLPPIKVAFAYSLYTQGKMDQSKMEKSALLGFPNAIKILIARTEQNKSNRSLYTTPFFTQWHPY